MTEQHPITPTSELIRKWNEEAATAPMADQCYIATQAARWGADQELEACCEWLKAKGWIYRESSDELRAARRLKQPSLKEQSLALIDKIQGNKEMWNVRDLDVVRQALEQLE